MPNSIPASAIVKITPNVLSAGGRALDLSGLILTTNSRAPVGSVVSFPDAPSVSSYFGSSSAEAGAASIYFLGFDNSNQKPGSLLFAQYNTAPVAAYLRGARVSGLTLAQLQAVSGTLTVMVDGAAKTGTVTLSTASSFSAAAGLIATALSANVAYDAVAGAFVVSSATTGAGSTVAYATGSAATVLGLSQTAGAMASQGAVAQTPGPFMDSVRASTTDWATFTTMFEPVIGDKLLFAAWTNNQNNDYAYVCWDTDGSPAAGAAPTSFGAQIKAGNYSGIVPVYLDPDVAFFVLGMAASIDFTQTNGRATAAFKGQTGLTPLVTDATTAQNLMANGYNFYGSYATANDQFRFFYPGSVSGPFLWLDSYLNEIWMTNQFQLALMVLLTNAKSIPYNTQGYALIEAACMDVINQAVNFGAIRPGVPLSVVQAVEINNDAGIAIDSILSTRGWYFQVKAATPQVRAARGTPPCKFWYTDGQSVQQINLPTVQVQ